MYSSGGADMKKLALISLASLCILPALSVAQALDPVSLLKPLGDSWPSYSDDYSSKRYTSLKQITQSNVKDRTLAWVAHVAYDPANGKILWHVGQVSYGPETHMLDGHPCILIAVGDSLYSFGRN
jgi:hypothetical protein